MHKTDLNEDLIIKAVEKYAAENGLKMQGTSDILECTRLFKDKISKLSPQEISLLKEAASKEDLQQLKAIIDEVKENA